MKGIIKRVYIIYGFVIMIGLVVIGQIIYLQYFAEIEISDADISYRKEEI